MDNGYGITNTGYVKKDYLTLMNDSESRLKSDDIFGSNIDFSQNDPLYHLFAAIEEGLSELWEVWEQVFYSGSPKFAEGVNLSNIGKLIGISRKQASKATGIERFTGTAGTVIPVNYQVQTNSNIIFLTTQTASIGSGGYADISIIAQNAGLSGVVAANTIIKIVNPMIGLDSVTNQTDTVGGQDEETDTAFRTRYIESTASGDGSTVEAIRSNLLTVTGVTDAKVEENVTDMTVNNIPPHSIYALVHGGNDADIAAAIFSKCAGGIESYGTTSTNITDSQGITHTISFSRPVQINVYIKIDVTTSASYPSDGNAQIIAAIKSYIDNISVGQDVLIYKLIMTISALNLTGLDDMAITLSTDGTTYSASNIAIDDDKIATTTVDKIEVV